MSTDISIIFSVSNLALAIAVFYFARKKDHTEDATQTAEVIVEMRNVRRDIGEIKGSIEAIRTEWREDHDSLIGVMREMRAMWKLIDNMKGVSNNEQRADH